MPKVTGARKTQLARRKSAAAAANQSKMSMSDEQIQNVSKQEENDHITNILLTFFVFFLWL